MTTFFYSGIFIALLIAGLCIGFMVLTAFIIIYLIKKNK